MQATLVDQAKRGDAEAFDSLARMVGDRCMAIAFRILRDADLAEDAVQTAFITAWRELRSLRNADLFEPWLHRILTHACYAEARHRSRWAAGIRLLPAEPGDRLDNTHTQDESDKNEPDHRRHTVEQRAVLVFHLYLVLSISEVAERIGIPLGTAKSRLHHATRAMRASLEADSRMSSNQERMA